MHVLGRPMVILNSPKAVRDLLDTKGANFSDRPQSIVLNDMYVKNYSLNAVNADSLIQVLDQDGPWFGNWFPFLW